MVMAIMSLSLSIHPRTACAQGERSADDVARELSNPTTALASLSNNLEYRSFKGDLPGADSQESWTYIFQPVLPFPQGDGKNIIFRPAFPLLLDQPVFNPAKNDFDSEGVEFGDISFDLAYGGTDKETGILSLFGIFGSLPTASDDAVGSEQWRLGPEVALGLIKEWGVIGTLITHNWDVGGSNNNFSVTTLQYFYALGLGNGWQLAAGPTISYDWEADSDNDWSIPVGVGIAKTTKVGNTPLKLALEVHNYLEQPDSFGPDWLVKLKVTPVIKNSFVK